MHQISNTWWVTLIAIASCGGNAANSDRGPPLRVVVHTDPASTAECPYGGSVVLSGLDEDRDGALDGAEVMTRTVLCNDPPVQPPAIAVRLVAEPAGAHCALGGTAVESGPDRNGNGRLDDDEVAHVDYVCGEALLTRLAAEAPGARCAAGGVAFLVGRDRNHDGVLGDDEVEQTELSCGTEVLHDVVVQTAADVAALANITVIAGSLTVDGTGLADLALPRLVEVRGALEVASDAALAHLAMPALQAVDGRLALLHDAQLAAIELPQLRRVGSLVIDGNPALNDLSGLPALAEVALDLQISHNDALVATDLPVTRVGRSAAIDGNAQLTHISWGVLESPATIHIASNPQLASADLGGAPASQVTIASNDQLARISVSGSVIGPLVIDGNPSLAEVMLTNAREITGDVVVRGNGPMTLWFIGSLEESLVIDGSLTLSGPIEQIFNLLGGFEIHGDYTLDGTSLSFFEPQELQVGGALHITNNGGLAVVAPSLPDGSYGFLVGGGLEIRNNGLTDLSFPGQTQIAGDVIIADNSALRAIPSLASLTRIRGNVRIASNPALQSVFGPSLAQVDGELVFDGDPGLADPGLAGLTHVSSLAVTNCSALAKLDLPALSGVDQGIEVRGNSALGEIELPMLQRADLGVFDNPQLSACRVDALFAAMLGDHHQSGNDSAAVCR